MATFFKASVKSFLIATGFSFLFLSGNAQHRNEAHDRGSRSPGRGIRESRSNQQRPAITHENVRSRGNAPASSRVQPPVRPSSSRGYGNTSPRPVTVAHSRGPVNPRYNRYNNGYRPVNRYPAYNAHNPSWRYGYLPRRHSVVTSFSFPYRTINYGGYGYRYYNGTYYQPYNNAFIVVAPPVGLFINVLPLGYRRIVVRDRPYYYYNGAYYDQYQDNYRVVAPPVGAVVESIPDGYETVVIDGETYYKVDGVQYKPIVKEDGEIWYEVLKVD